MRIAQIAPVWYTVPPPGYGGIELVVGLLADTLVERGHDVTLFASGGSHSRAKIVSPLEQPPDPALLGNTWFDLFHTLSAYQSADEFDIVHDHTGPIGPALAAARTIPLPVVHTLHGPWTEPARRYYSLVDEMVHLVAISQAQRQDNPGLRYAGTVHNGIDLDAYPFRAEKENRLLFIGRANPDKGPATAVEVARRVGLPLTMIVKKNEPFERDYWDNWVAPQLTDDMEVLEGVSHEVKVDLLGRSKALLFPIQWPEPFGLVMVEAMACGTPVIAGRAGAAIEVVEDGRTGFLCDSADHMVEVVEQAGGLDPVECRAAVAERFSATAMVESYERIFKEVAGQ